MQRVSPIHDQLAILNPGWIVINQMSAPSHFPGPAMGDVPAADLADLSCLQRWGCKGPGAAAWLEAQGLPVPVQPNTWKALPGGSLVARLGINEFLVEDGPECNRVPPLAAAEPTAGVYPVPRQDAVLALWGTAAPLLLRQTCSVDFAALSHSTGALAITSMVGVPLTVIPESREHFPLLRLYCDGTYGPYLWQTLLDIAGELGGGAAATGTAFALLQHP